MEKIIFETLNLNQVINFQTVISCFGLYILLFWFVVCIWIYFDANKRYQSRFLAFLIASCVFIFSFPVLILYLLLRKEVHEIDDVSNINYEIDNLHIPTIPVVDFVKNGDIKFRIEVSIVPINKIESDAVDNNFKKDDIKVSLVEYLKESTNKGSEIDKRIKKNIHKLLNLLKNKKENKEQF